MADHKGPRAQIIDSTITSTRMGFGSCWPLELLQVEASTRAMATPDDIRADRVDHTPTLASYETGRLIDARIGADEPM